MYCIAFLIVFNNSLKVFLVISLCIIGRNNLNFPFSSKAVEINKNMTFDVMTEIKNRYNKKIILTQLSEDIDIIKVNNLCY